MKKVISLIVLTLAILILSACGETQRERGETVEITHTVSEFSGYDESEEAVYTRVEKIEEFGKNPKVVISLTLEAVDILANIGLDTLGIEWFSFVKSNLPPSLRHLNIDEYPNAGPSLFAYDPATFDLMQPDLIIVGGRSSSLYTELKENYPNADILDVSNTTYSFDAQKKVFNNLSLIFDGASELLSYIETYEAAYEEIKEAAAGKEAMVVIVSGTSLSVFGLNSRYHAIFNDFGFTPADDTVGTSERPHGETIHFEYISQVAPEYLFLIDRNVSLGNDATTDQVIGNTLIQDTPAGQNDRIFVLDAYAWYIYPGGITSTQAMISDFRNILDLE